MWSRDPHFSTPQHHTCYCIAKGIIVKPPSSNTRHGNDSAACLGFEHPLGLESSTSPWLGFRVSQAYFLKIPLTLKGSRIPDTYALILKETWGRKGPMAPMKAPGAAQISPMYVKKSMVHGQLPATEASERNLTCLSCLLIDNLASAVYRNCYCCNQSNGR